MLFSTHGYLATLDINNYIDKQAQESEEDIKKWKQIQR